MLLVRRSLPAVGLLMILVVDPRDSLLRFHFGCHTGL